MKKTTKTSSTIKPVKKAVPIPSDVLAALDEFQKAYEEAGGNVQKMAMIYARTIHKRPSAGDIFAKRFPKITENRWQRLRLIGNGDIDPDVWLVSDRAAMTMMRLGPETSKTLISAIDTGIEIYDSRTGKPRIVSVKDISAHTVNILVDKKTNTLRSMQEQIEYVDELRNKQKSKFAGTPYVVSTGCVEILRKCVLGRSDLQHIISQMFNGDGDEIRKFTDEIVKRGEQR